MLGFITHFRCSRSSPTSKRNLAAFDLEIDEVVGDGDCAFTSIIKQLHKAVPNMTENAKAHVRSIGWLHSLTEGRLRSASNVC